MRARLDALPSGLWTAAKGVLTLALVLVVLHAARSVADHGVYGPYGGRVYYDAYHGAHHLWNRDNGRDRHAYHTVSGYYRYYQTLLDAGLSVDVATDHGFDRDTLDDYDAFYVGEQTQHGNFMTDREVEDLRDWVRDGGGLFITAEHTNAYHMNDVVNRLLEGIDMRARNDGLSDRKQRGPSSADWVVISQPEEGEVHPVAEGVDAYTLFAGCSVDTPHGVLFSSKSSWSDRYGAHAPPLFPADGKRQRDELGGPLPGVAAMDVDAGRIVLVCDHNAFSNPNIYWGDHHRFARQSMAWLAGDRVNPDLGWGALALMALLGGLWVGRHGRTNWRDAAIVGAVAIAVGLSSAGWRAATRAPTHDVLFVRSATAATRLMTKQDRGHYTFYACATRDPHLRPWVDDTVTPGYDALVLVAPMDALDDDELAIADAYLAAGKTVLYLANKKSLESAGGRQLAEHFGFEVTMGEPVFVEEGADEMPYRVEGPPDLTRGVFRFWVSQRILRQQVTGLDPVVVLTPAGRRPPEDDPRAAIDEQSSVVLLSERQVGPGTFAVLAPIGLFDSGALGDLYDIQDRVREQMRELSVRVIARTVAHDWERELKPER